MKNAAKITALLMALTVGAHLAACGNDETAANEGTYNYSLGLDENGFFEGVVASELVTLPEYKGVDIDKEIPVVSEDELKEQLDGILSAYHSYEEITDRAAKDGDTVNIDYVGYIDGTQFDGGNTGGLGTDVTIGVTNYIEGFLDQLIGHMPGESFDVVVTFPEDYGIEELNGKEATFKTTLNYIQGAFIEAELTDEIAKEYGFDTAEALVADIEDWIVSSDKFYFFTDLLAGATCDEVPESVIEYLKNYDLSQYEYYAAMSGMTTEEYIINNLGYESLDAYVAGMQEKYRSDATLYLAAQAIAELENITVTSDMIKEAGHSDYVSEYGEPYIKQFMLFQEIIPQFIIDNGNLVEIAEDTTGETAEA